ncbi:FAD/NAD(P)-binding protein [Advenella kashmirensis]
MDASCRLGIVGGGSVGISFLAQLVGHLENDGNSASNTPACHITLFEPAEKIGHGTAYQHDLNTNLLNVPAGNMSLYDKHRSHFVQWLAAQPEALLQSYGIRNIDPAAFYPRPLFGRYVHEQFDRIVAQAAALGIQVQVVRNAVVAITRHAAGQGQAYEPGQGQEAQSQFQLTDLAGANYIVDQLVLCNGNLASDKFDALVPCAGFMNSPYPVSALSQTIVADATVAILGTNLSAIDAVVALKAHAHGGQIHCFSRQGVLPAVRSVHPTHIPCRLSRSDVHAMALAKGGRLGLDDGVQMLREQMLAIDPGFDIRDIEGGSADAATLLDHELQAACSGPRPWQAVLAAANEVIDLLWFYLDQPARRQFQSRWRSRWMSRRAMFPVQNARQLQCLIEAGQLHIHGGFQACEALADRQGFVLHSLDAAGALQQQVCDVVINATGFSQDVRQSADPLVTQLLQSGLARASEYGGFELDFDTGCLVSANGTIANDITVLGSLACGTYFWTVSMDVNARLANDQAMRLAGKLCQQRLAQVTSVPEGADAATQV